MTHPLIERVAKAIGSAPLDLCDDTIPEFTPEARAAILAVLDWFSEPGNITGTMQKAAEHCFEADPRFEIAAAMRAAREEMSK